MQTYSIQMYRVEWWGSYDRNHHQREIEALDEHHAISQIVALLRHELGNLTTELPSSFDVEALS